ncbi:RNAse P Rpr2/Rpp21/SNM1 subunit domain-containing protein [Glomus cerebriforme]|uniref:RNAse P Rpr2/Rpp21/SNM1 subunit domain-containing protein n=1 Tax=Glomus cerebriforme TaxID=658196 RepID=A0A397T1V8_9GLOM|nr:RNAse P Rpr2/Rpp21/SNM1 subunit domain-containing protein [Glomus cerebriforme]
MGKKKEKNSEPRFIQHRELYQRMNFLYQAATLMTTITTSIPQTPNSTQLSLLHSCSEQDQVLQQKEQSKLTRSNDTTNSINLDNTKNLASLGRFYVNTMKTIGTKQVLRIDPSIKRTLCKRCESILLPGVTSKVRMKSRPEPHLQVMCTECNTSKNYSARKGYQLFSEKPENIFGSNESSSGDNEVIPNTQGQLRPHQKQKNQKQQLQPSSQKNK